MKEDVPSPIRLIDIAQRTGVSVGTVARVINHVGKGNIRVSLPTREKILSVARELHYVPNQAARALLGKRCMKIGVLVDSQAPQGTVRALWSAEEEAVREGYRIMFGRAHDNPHALFECYDNFMQHGIDGVICFSHEYSEHEVAVREFFQSKPNIVYMDSPGWDAPHVNVRRDVGMSEAISHLYETGRSRIAFWLPERKVWHSFSQRLMAYRQCVHGEELLIDAENVKQCLESVREKHVDAIIAANDFDASLFIRFCLLNGIRVPDDIAVIGNDNERFTGLIFPSISTVDEYGEDVGKHLFKLLLNQINHESSDWQIDVETHLIVRESSGAKRTSNECQ